MSSPVRKPNVESFPDTTNRAPARSRKQEQSPIPQQAAVAAHEIQTEWDRVAGTKAFKDLMYTKKMFIVPAFIFFVVYYFLLPVLVGYAPKFMDTKVGPVNLAYIFALSQFFVAWIIAGLYVKAANGFDKLSKDIIDNLSKDSAARLANSRGGN